MIHKGNGLITRVAIFALAAILVLPAFVFAGQGRGKGKNKGRGKPTEVFVNGHDARDGRWDKGGPKNKNKNRDRDYDDDDRYDDDDDRDDDGRNDRGRLRQIGFDNGYREGVQEGREDRSNGERFDYNDEGEFRDATSGYRNEYGSVDTYRGYFREGYARGYRDGYEGRSSNRRTGVRDILGDILGTP